MKFIVRSVGDKNAVKGYIDDLKDGKSYIISIGTFTKSRSNEQNSLYWLWLTCIGDETGDDKNSIHEYFKKRFLKHENMEVFEGMSFADSISITASTAKLNMTQFRHYMNKVKEFAATELDITLPEKDDPYYEQFYEYFKNLV